MKKTLFIATLVILTTGMTFAASDFSKAFKNSVKQDVQNTRNQYRQAVQQDIENQRKANVEASQAKKAEKIKQIDNKLKDLNREMAQVKADKNKSETEKLFKVRSIQRQIDFYNNQKAALK